VFGGIMTLTIVITTAKLNKSLRKLSLQKKM